MRRDLGYINFPTVTGVISSQTGISPRKVGYLGNLPESNSRRKEVLAGSNYWKLRRYFVVYLPPARTDKPFKSVKTVKTVKTDWSGFFDTRNQSCNYVPKRFLDESQVGR